MIYKSIQKMDLCIDLTIFISHPGSRTHRTIIFLMPA